MYRGISNRSDQSQGNIRTRILDISYALHRFEQGGDQASSSVDRRTERSSQILVRYAVSFQFFAMYNKQRERETIARVSLRALKRSSLIDARDRPGWLDRSLAFNF